MASTRERIIDAALHLFAKRGFAGTTITAIEQAVGLAAGTGSFHRHFSSKRAVFDAAIDREIGRLREIRPVKMPNYGSSGGQEALARQLVSDLGFLRQVRVLLAILLQERTAMPEAVDRVREALVDTGLTGIVSDLETFAPNDVARADPEAASAVLLCATLGYFLTAEFFGTAPGGIDSDRYTRTLAALLSSTPGNNTQSD